MKKIVLCFSCCDFKGCIGNKKDKNGKKIIDTVTYCTNRTERAGK